LASNGVSIMQATLRHTKLQEPNGYLSFALASGVLPM
jgi:hypothetical protein